MIDYPEEFKQKVKKYFPNSLELHELVDNNQYFIGKRLDDARCLGISPARILEYFECDKLEELQQEARVGHKRNMLYAEWCDLVKNKQ